MKERLIVLLVLAACMSGKGAEPVVSILTPASGALVSNPVSLALEVTSDEELAAVEVRGGLVGAPGAWQTGLDAAGRMSLLLPDLMPGTQEIVVEARDQGGDTGTDSVELEIFGVVITFPAEGQKLLIGPSLFQAEIGIGGVVTWSLDGELLDCGVGDSAAGGDSGDLPGTVDCPWVAALGSRELIVVLEAGEWDGQAQRIVEVVEPSGLDVDNDGVAADIDCDDTDPLISAGELRYYDHDGDGFGGEEVFLCEGEVAPDGLVLQGGDCEDWSADVWPGAPEICDLSDNDCDGEVNEEAVDFVFSYLDGDGDGFGAGIAATGCDVASGYVTDNHDCDDQNIDINPAVQDVCNGIDDNCDGSIDDDPAVMPEWFPDNDGDGYGKAPSVFACDAPADHVAIPGDCDDSTAIRYPGAAESCNGADDDCDGFVDDSSIDGRLWAVDADHDGHGSSSGGLVRNCDQPAGSAPTADDCDDNNAAVYPGAPETCDNLDTDCNGLADTQNMTIWYFDSDGDGYGDAALTLAACDLPAGYAADLDCDDGNVTVNPGAQEICNGVDEDCNGVADDNAGNVFYRDADGDGYGDPLSTLRACSFPVGYSARNTDCDDLNSATHPGATETCDALDNNCDGNTGGATTSAIWYADADGDGYGDAATWHRGCSPLTGYVANLLDCDDAESAAWQGAPETCDGVDNDCDGITDPATADDVTIWYLDGDGDGYGTTSITACAAPAGYGPGRGDCDDTDATVHPGAPEYCGFIDYDCDNATNEVDAVDAQVWYFDNDADGYGDPVTSHRACTPAGIYTLDGTDCNDAAYSINPGQVEQCNAGDENCDALQGDDDPRIIGQLLFYQDSDGDGYGALTSPVYSCAVATGRVLSPGDCDDGDAGISPVATEICNAMDDDCDGEINENALDVYDQAGSNNTESTATYLGDFGFGNMETIEITLNNEEDVDYFYWTIEDDGNRDSDADFNINIYADVCYDVELTDVYVFLSDSYSACVDGYLTVNALQSSTNDDLWLLVIFSYENYIDSDFCETLVIEIEEF